MNAASQWPSALTKEKLREFGSLFLRSSVRRVLRIWALKADSGKFSDARASPTTWLSSGCSLVGDHHCTVRQQRCTLT